ncbi:MAG TPA: D-glycerate dehydrogenase [Solirubrobacterales bacterium]|jgi:glyoxylate reductase
MPVADRPRFAVTGRLPAPALALLDGAGEAAVAEVGAPLPRAELLAHVAGAAAIVCFLYDRVDAELLDAAGPELQVVANVAVGYDNVDLEAAAARGVAVANTPGVLDDATADLTLALLLAAARRLGEGERLIRAGRPWAWGLEFMLGRDLAGKRLGIVGLGAIGGRVARRARAFGIEVAYANRSPADPELVAELGAERLELEPLLATSDFVSLHAPLTPETRGLISAERLALMKPEAILVNTARGPVVDEAALAAALRERRIAAAALDVYEHEPQVHPELLGLENVVLLPHLGSATVETREAMATLAARNAVAAVRGEPLPTPVPA